MFNWTRDIFVVFKFIPLHYQIAMVFNTNAVFVYYLKMDVAEHTFAIYSFLHQQIITERCATASVIMKVTTIAHYESV